MHPRRITSPAASTRQKRRQNLIFGWSRSCISSQRGADWRYLHQTPASACSPAMCCCERRRFDQFLPIPVFASHRAAFFFCFVAAQRSPTFFRNPNVTSQTTTTTPHHTTKKNGNPPSGLPLFRQIQPNPTRGVRLSLRRIQLAVSHNPFEPKSGRSRLAGLSWGFN